VTGIVRALKDFARGGEELGPCRLNDAVRSVVEISRHEWTAVAELQLNLDPELGTVICHEGELKESLLAVIMNAVEAVAEKRERLPGTPPGTIEVSTRAVPGAARIVVRDSGVGMDDAVRRRVFDPFFTTKPVGRGSGQGLHFAYGAVVTHHGGAIDVASVPGQGSTFTITLPDRAPSGAASPGGQDGDQGEQGGNGLDEQDPAAGRGSTVTAGHGDAAEEEDGYVAAEVTAGQQAPDQARGQEAVVEPLVGGQRDGGVGELRGGAERGAGARGAPQEHLQHEDVPVQQGHQRHQRPSQHPHGGQV